jgi:hypothetical protein
MYLINRPFAFSFVSKSLVPLWCPANKEIRYTSVQIDMVEVENTQPYVIPKRYTY